MRKSRSMNSFFSRPGRPNRSPAARAIVNRIAISPGLEWVREFLVQAAPLAPLHKLRSVKGYKTKGKWQDYTQGLIWRKGRVREITIAEYVQTHRGHAPRPPGIILEVLAHELAHLVEWEHTPEHWILELKIMNRFARLCKRVGIKDRFEP